VLDEGGSGGGDDIIASIERSVDLNQDGDFEDRLDVISLSLGGSGNPDDDMSLAIDNAVELGVVAVVAAGNSGPSEESIGSPGTARKAITVGAIDKEMDMAGFSSKGPVIWEDVSGNKVSLVKPDVVAPGVEICAAQWEDAWDWLECLDNEHTAISGTSMATPHVAGLAALIKQRNPGYSSEEIKSVIKNTAELLPNFEKVTTQGHGLVDTMESVFFDEPLIVNLNPLEQEVLEIDISGRIEGENFEHYDLAYAENIPLLELNEADWTLVTTSDDIPSDETLYANFNLVSFSDGKYLIRSRAFDTSARIFEDYGFLEVNKFDFIEPLNNDIINPKDDVLIRVENVHDLPIDSFEVEYSFEEGPWTSEGVVVDVTDLEATILADTIIANGEIDVKASIVHEGFSDEFFLEELYADTTLKQGWPQRIQFDICNHPFSGELIYFWAGRIEPAVGDVNGDGEDEVVIYSGGCPPKVKVYANSGSLLQEINVGELGVPGGGLTHPLLADLDHDDIDEIIVFVNGKMSWEGEDHILPKIHAFNFDGSEVDGWPIEFELWGAGIVHTLRRFSLSAKDLDLDGSFEIIARDYQYGSYIAEQLLVINEDGNIQNEINLPESGVTTFGGRPAVSTIGNFDEDPDFEIIFLDFAENVSSVPNYNNATLVIYNQDGSILNGFPVYLPGRPSALPVVGDINNDGEMEIVFGLSYGSDTYPDANYGGLYVIDRNGSILSNWPQFTGEIINSVALADLYGNNELEIVAVSLIFDPETGEPADMKMYVVDSQGNLIHEWSDSDGTNIFQYYFTSIGSVDEGEIGFITSTDALIDDKFVGRVMGKDLLGNSLVGFPKFTEFDTIAQPLITDIDNSRFVEVIASSDSDKDRINGISKHRASMYVWETQSEFNEENQEWPQYQHDKSLTGCYDCIDELQCPPNWQYFSQIDKCVFNG
ncbi:S8 family serine peptidase, partial [Patescibacteria group bacterium]|nr:S8 family serine peptidase [Patescibacteria group bacterium]